MFAWRPIFLLTAVAGVLLLAVARPSSGSAPEQRYVVQPGDTLWGLAAERYAGDPREAIWRIRERNDLDGSWLPAGTVLYLPARAGGA